MTVPEPLASHAAIVGTLAQPHPGKPMRTITDPHHAPYNPEWGWDGDTLWHRVSGQLKWQRVKRISFTKARVQAIATLAATEGSTESVVARDDAAELRAALEMLLNASHRGGYDSGLTIEAVERAEALIAPGLTQERRIELAHAAWLDGLKRRLTTFEESRLAASEGQP